MNCNPDINRMECWICQHNPFIQRVPVVYAGGIISPGSNNSPVEKNESDNLTELIEEVFNKDDDDFTSIQNNEKERINRLWNMLMEQTVLICLTCESAMETHDVIKDSGTDGDRSLLGNLMDFYKVIHGKAEEILDYLEAHSTPREV